MTKRERQIQELEQIILECVRAFPRSPDGTYHLPTLQTQVLIALQRMNKDREYGGDISTRAYKNLFEEADKYHHAALKNQKPGNENR